MFNIEFSIQAQMLQHLLYGAAGAKTLAVRLKAKFPKSGIQCIAAYQPDGTRSFVRELTITAADTEQEFFVTFPGDASGVINDDNGEGFRISIPLVAGTNFHATKDAWAANEDYATSNQQNMLDNTANNIEITGLKVEVGEFSTPYEHVAFDVDLERCTLHYERSYEYGTATGTVTTANQIHTLIPTATGNVIDLSSKLRRKRASPTMTWYSPGTGASGNIRQFTGTPTDRAVLSTVGEGEDRTGYPTVAATVANTGLSAHYVVNARMR